MDHRALALFERNPDRAPVEPLPQLGHPGVQHVGPLIQLKSFDGAAAGGLHLDRVSLIPQSNPMYAANS